MTTEGGVEGLFHILRSYLIRDFKRYNTRQAGMQSSVDYGTEHLIVRLIRQYHLTHVA